MKVKSVKGKATSAAVLLALVSFSYANLAHAKGAGRDRDAAPESVRRVEMEKISREAAHSVSAQSLREAALVGRIIDRHSDLTVRLTPNGKARLKRYIINDGVVREAVVSLIENKSKLQGKDLERDADIGSNIPARMLELLSSIAAESEKLGNSPDALDKWSHLVTMFTRVVIQDGPFSKADLIEKYYPIFQGVLKKTRELTRINTESGLRDVVLTIQQALRVSRASSEDFVKELQFIIEQQYGHSSALDAAVQLSARQSLLTSVSLFRISPEFAQKAVQIHKGLIVSVDMTPNKQTILTASGDGKIIVWDKSTGAPTATFKSHGVIKAARFEDGTIKAEIADGTVETWNARHEVKVDLKPIDEGAVARVRDLLSPSGSGLEVSEVHGTASRVVNNPTNKPVSNRVINPVSKSSDLTINPPDLKVDKNGAIVATSEDMAGFNSDGPTAYRIKTSAAEHIRSLPSDSLKLPGFAAKFYRADAIKKSDGTILRDVYFTIVKSKNESGYYGISYIDPRTGSVNSLDIHMAAVAHGIHPVEDYEAVVQPLVGKAVK
jgi:hypothetical protein